VRDYDDIEVGKIFYYVPPLADVFQAISHERERQDAKWGEQNHPDGTADHADYRRVQAEFRRAQCELAAASGGLTWRHILDEEVAEAFAESDPVKLRMELIQIAAVAVAWCQAIDRRGEGK
jgi:hypothetical protein